MFLSSFDYKGKIFHVLVNGQSGKCSGESPVSALRVLMVVAAVLLIIGGIFYMLNSSGVMDAETVSPYLF